MPRKKDIESFFNSDQGLDSKITTLIENINEVKAKGGAPASDIKGFKNQIVDIKKTVDDFIEYKVARFHKPFNKDVVRIQLLDTLFLDLDSGRYTNGTGTSNNPDAVIRSIEKIITDYLANTD